MEFLNYVKSYCEEHKIELIVSEKNRVGCYSIQCNGFFDPSMPSTMNKNHIIDMEKFKDNTINVDNRMVLAYSVGGKTEEEILSLVAHEFGHANQYIESSHLWVEPEKFLIWDNYFSDTSIKISKVKKVWGRIVQLEADCEQRVLKFIDEFNLNIDKNKYAQKANAYLFFYNFALSKRMWYKKAPYELENIVKEMPDEIFDLEYYSDLENKEIISKEQLFKECFK